MANFALTNGSSASGGTQQNVAANFLQATISVAASSINGGNSPLRRGKMYDILVGTNAAPADTYVEWAIDRITATSTTTNLQGLPLDSADPGTTSLMTQCMVNSSQHGTVTAGQQLWYVGMNQRASYRWVCAPGSELVWPATASNGLTLRPKGSYASTVTATVMCQEQ